MRHKNVLLIDDDPIFNIITRKTLEKIGFAEKIITMTSGTSALKYLTGLQQVPEQVPDVIFLDIRMPGMSGFDFLEEYDKLPGMIKDKPWILILSSSENMEDIARANSNPYVYKFITKPLEERQIKGIEFNPRVK